MRAGIEFVDRLDMKIEATCMGAMRERLPVDPPLMYLRSVSRTQQTTFATSSGYEWRGSWNQMAKNLTDRPRQLY